MSFKYSDERSQQALHLLKSVYAFHVKNILDEVAEESCIHHSSNAIKKWPRDMPFCASYHNKSRSWKVKIHRYGRKAFTQVKESYLMQHWTDALNQLLTPPGHPSEFHELVSTIFRWTEVIDEEFIKQVLSKVQKLCPRPNPYQMITPDYLTYKPPVIWIDADDDTELFDSSDDEDLNESDF